MSHELPKLDYSYNSLEPFIDAKTMEIHHSKHHQTYVDKLNKALEGTGLENKPVEELLKNLDKLPQDKKHAIINNGGGHFNHSFFWKILKKGTKPNSKILDTINKKYTRLE